MTEEFEDLKVLPRAIYLAGGMDKFTERMGISRRMLNHWMFFGKMPLNQLAKCHAEFPEISLSELLSTNNEVNTLTNKTGIQELCQQAGGYVKLAKILDVSRQTVEDWYTVGYPTVRYITRIKRLFPDIAVEKFLPTEDFIYQKNNVLEEVIKLAGGYAPLSYKLKVSIASIKNWEVKGFVYFDEAIKINKLYPQFKLSSLLRKFDKERLFKTK